MLVLTRRAGDAILLGDDIEISIIEMQGDKVKIGINAPKSVAVLRKELKEEAAKANAQAASPQIDLEMLGKALKNR